MHNLVSQRFGQKQQAVIVPLNHTMPDDEANQPPPPFSPPVKPSVLREKLLEKLNPKPKIVINEQAEEVSIELVHFASLFEFVHWYEENSQSFSERQREPLNSLIEARNITLGGCNCDREKRTLIANDYFRKFWTQNKNTDLLPTLQNILRTKKVLFCDFLIYPE